MAHSSRDIVTLIITLNSGHLSLCPFTRRLINGHPGACVFQFGVLSVD